MDHSLQRAPANEAAVGAWLGNLAKRGSYTCSLLSIVFTRGCRTQRHHVFIIVLSPTRRYHYNVANTRVEQHVEKGNDDGLYISSVACCQELWALIMDAGTGFTAQVYNLSQHFLPKEWIMEKWEEGYYITAMAGSMSGSSLVVMSKGTPYTQQSYKVSDSFPFKWINKKWKEGFYVTSMATSHTR